MLKTESPYQKILNRLSELPSLPEVVARVLELTANEAPPAEIARAIEADPGITAKVLKLVNSAFYSLKNPIANLTHACSLLGGRTIKSLVLSVSAMSMFKRNCSAFDTVRFWRNALATALVSRIIATEARLSSEQAEEAYIAGLLHAGGVPLFAQFYPNDYARVLESWGQGENILDLEEDFFGAAHPEAGWEVANHWRFPGSIGEVIRYHRVDPVELAENLDQHVLRLLDVVRLADFWTRRAGVSIADSDVVAAESPAIIPAWMKFDEAFLAEKIGPVEERLAGLESIFTES